MIKINRLTIDLGSFHLFDLDLEIQEEEFHFLIGPTGVGKTLILESIMGLHKPKKGRIWIGDREVQSLPPEQREISYVPQDSTLFPHLRVKENILYGIRAKNLALKAYEGYVQALIEVMKIEHLLERYPANLSGGEKKRVALLRGLAPKPKLLLLDEPLTGLDPSIKFEIQQLLKTLHTSFRPTILCVTHDFDDAYLLGDKITVFIDGRIEQVGSKEDIFLRPGSRKVAEFLGIRNLFRVKVLGSEGSSQRWILGLNGLQLSLPARDHPLHLEAGKELDLYIRPEEVMIIREGKPVKDSLRRNIFEGKITDITDRGRYHLVHFQTREGEVLFEISIPNYAFRNLNLTTGKTVRVALRDESLWVMG
ncbi:MAG: ABC transporter ATP-binding protein [Syntrophaceae bacterium]|nr:ABC transporter ATP-binding protein [Syntrophaceae bacterium]